MGKLLKKYIGSPLWPALLSGLVAPGVGQIYNKDFKRGALLLIVFLGGFLWFSSILTEQLSVFISTPPETWMQDPEKLKVAITGVVSKNPDMFVTFYAMMILTWLFAVVDAYFSAKNPKPVVRALPDEDADLNG